MKAIKTGLIILFLLTMVSSLLLTPVTICPVGSPSLRNAVQLGRAIIVYCHDHNGSCPNKNTWCDDILDEAGTPKLFISPLDPEVTKMEQAWPEKVSSYAFNAAASENQLSHAELVILFETNLGWNGSGGLEEALGTLKAYDGKPIAVVFADGHVELISSEERLQQLMWNPAVPAQSLFENFSEEDEEWEKFCEQYEENRPICGWPGHVEIHFQRTGYINVYRINEDKSITLIADIDKDGIRRDYWLKRELFPWEKNTKIEGKIRAVIGKPTGELTKADLEKVTGLDLGGNKLTDVKGLEKLAQLDILTLANNQLTDVKGLEKLTQLKVLNLQDNQLTDLKGLEKLTQLKVLGLDLNPDLTKAQIDELQKALPNCKIISNPAR